MRYAIAVLALSLLGAGAWAQAPAAASKIAPLPPGNGRSIVAHSCTMCHTLARIERQHQDRAWWAKTVASMNQKGAGLTPAQVKVVVAYLAKNYGPKPGAAHHAGGMKGMQ